MRGTLTSDGYCVAEGFSIVEEALRSNREVSAIVVSQSARHAAEQFPANAIVTVPDTLFRTISSTTSPQGVTALVRPRELHGWDEFFLGTPLLVVVDGIQDPGNAGAVIRSAEAFGATGVIFTLGSVSPYNPKAIRASAGSVFRVPIADGESSATVIEKCGLAGATVYAAMPGDGASAFDVDLTHSCALLIGAEGRGISEEFHRRAARINIPTRGVESLNAAVAAAVLIYEASRQRSGRR
jgi:RNA methyltransferase, TrmH family